MKYQPKKLQHKINNAISASQVYVLTQVDNKPIRTLYSITDAIILAEKTEEDLIQITNDAIPICRIMEYSKFLFQQKKNQKPQKTLKKKVIKFHPSISEHDIEHKVKHIIEFIKEGHQVLIQCTFKGREMKHMNIGMDMMKSVILQTDSVAKVVQPLTKEKNNIFATLSKK